MSANLRRYRAIRAALTQCYPGEPKGHVARHLTTLAALISGIGASKSTQRPQVASQVPEGTKPESRVKRFARGVGNERITEAGYLLPYADVLLRHVALHTLVLVIAGSGGGRGCIALMRPVVYTGRALPLAWLVRQGKKGHFSEAVHLAMVAQGQELIPLGAQVVLRGDGACDGLLRQQTLQEAGWASGGRTGCPLTAAYAGEPFRLATVGGWLKPGTLVD